MSATAETIGSDLLITGDKRQFNLCHAIGLTTERIPA